MNSSEVGPSHPHATELPARPNRRRTWIIAAVAAGAVIATAVIAIVASVTSGPSAAGPFAKAHAPFHAQFAARSAALNNHLQQAGNGTLVSLSDPSFIAATNDAKTVANLYHNYAESVEAISMPAAAKAGKAQLIRDAAAGQFLMNQAADSFTKSGTQAIGGFAVAAGHDAVDRRGEYRAQGPRPDEIARAGAVRRT